MFNTIFLQAPANQTIFTVLLWVGIIGVMYFFMIRPQQQKQKEQKKFIENLKKGDEVVTIGGLHGKVSSFNDNTVTIEVNNNGTKLTFDKSSLSRLASQAPKAE